MRRISLRTIVGAVFLALVCLLLTFVINNSGHRSSNPSKSRTLEENCNCPKQLPIVAPKQILLTTTTVPSQDAGTIVQPRTCTPVDEKSSVQRAILIYYPHHQSEYFFPEVRWLYRSWKEMLLGQPEQWRTDFVIFSYNYSREFHQLGCVNRQRTNKAEESICRYFLYVPIRFRVPNVTMNEFKTAFDDVKTTLKSFGHKNETFVTLPDTWDNQTFDRARSQSLYVNLRSYEYIDSINTIFEGYRTFKMYDFILRTDIDVFIYRHFATYIPKNCSFMTGGGGYGTHFNRRKLGRIARDMGFAHANISGMGSTWYGSPYDAYLVANQTLHSMLWLSRYEFAEPEREGKLGTLMWPEWHYGVLLLYGQHLALNHLQAINQISVHIGHDLLDQSTTDDTVPYVKQSIRLNLHCWHTDDRFSKFYFKANRYNDSELLQYANDTTARAYAMRMAIESKKMTLEELAAYGGNRTRKAA